MSCKETDCDNESCYRADLSAHPIGEDGAAVQPKSRPSSAASSSSTVAKASVVAALSSSTTSKAAGFAPPTKPAALAKAVVPAVEDAAVPAKADSPVSATSVGPENADGRFRLVCRDCRSCFSRDLERSRSEGYLCNVCRVLQDVTDKWRDIGEDVDGRTRQSVKRQLVVLEHILDVEYEDLNRED